MVAVVIVVVVEEECWTALIAGAFPDGLLIATVE